MTETLSRRKFLRLSAGVMGATAVMTSTPRLIDHLAGETPTITPAAVWLETAVANQITPTVCALCPSGCGMLARVADGNLVQMAGSPMHPINLGALCPKGQAAPELLYNPDRLTEPMRRVGERGDGGVGEQRSRGAGEWEAISWDDAVRLVAERLGDLRDAGHPQRAALLYGETRGQMRGFLQRFMTAVGSPNAISHDSLNIEAAKLANLFTQGIYDLPAYDLENSHYVLSFGAGLLETGRNPQRTIGGYGYMRRGRAERGKLVHIDPRQGITGAKADEWIPIVPGTDGALALAIANVIIKTGRFDSDFV
ncbi:MAG: molybdopterin-dependent oxidoreductase, partial [Anaerolineae bacterium]